GCFVSWWMKCSNGLPSAAGGTSCVVANGIGAMLNGVCQVRSCNAGFADCDRSPVNGCEAKISTDPKNWGSCGQALAQGMKSSNGMPSGLKGTASELANGIGALRNGVCQVRSCNAG